MQGLIKEILIVGVPCGNSVTYFIVNMSLIELFWISLHFIFFVEASEVNFSIRA